MVIFSIAVGLINIIWAMTDMMGIVTAMLAATNPLVILGYYFLFVMSLVAVMSTIQTMIAFCNTMDDRYLGSLAFDLAMNLTITVAFKGLQRLSRNLDDLFEKAMKKLDDVDNGHGSTGAGDGSGSGTVSDNVYTIIKFSQVLKLQFLL